MSEPKTVIRNKKGKPDDVVIEDVSCFRMERMSRKGVWIAAYRGDKCVTFWIGSDSKITISLNEDELGCVDDTEEIDVLSAAFSASEAERIRTAAQAQGKLLTQFIREAVVESALNVDTRQ